MSNAFITFCICLLIVNAAIWNLFFYWLFYMKLKLDQGKIQDKYLVWINIVLSIIFAILSFPYSFSLVAYLFF